LVPLPFRRLFGSFAVNQPRYPESIDEHAKTRGPERLLERHRNLTVLAQLVKIRSASVVLLIGAGEAFWLS
jgi:hypothetical protein